MGNIYYGGTVISWIDLCNLGVGGNNDRFKDAYVEYANQFSDFECYHELHMVTMVVKAFPESDGFIRTYCSVCNDPSVYYEEDIYHPAVFELSQKRYIYNGKAKKPTLRIYNSDDCYISPSDYTVTYSKNKNVGTATATVKFHSEYYEGSKKVTYKIVPKGTSIKGLASKKTQIAVSWKLQKTQTSGYQVQYSKSKKMTKPKYVTAKKNTYSYAVISKLSRRKTYYVRVRTYKTVNGKKYYSNWSKIKSIKTR